MLIWELNDAECEFVSATPGGSVTTDDKTPPKRNEKGPITMFKEASEVAALKASEAADRTEKRDARQDERTDKAYGLALDAAKGGQASAERTVKMLYALLAASLLAVVILTAMVLDAKLNVSANGVSVGAEAETKM